VVFTLAAAVPYLRGNKAVDAPELHFGGGRAHPIRLAVDVLAALPFLLVFAPASVQLLWLLKLYRVVRLMRLWRHFEIRRPALPRLLFLSYWVVLLTHWVTCGWMSLHARALGSGIGHRYLASLYYCVSTLTSVGYGDIVPANDHERLYAIMLMLLGIGIYGFVIGTVAAILANIDLHRASHFQRMEQLSAFMTYRNIPAAVGARIGNYYRYLWQHRLDQNETELLDRLPLSLRTEVLLHLRRDLLQAVPLFSDADDTFIREIALSLTPVFFLPGDYVIRAGDRDRDMYFINRGTVEVIGPDGATVLAHLGTGDFFGEMALLDDAPRAASVRALDYCDLYRLERARFETVLSQYPAVAGQIRTRAEERRAANAALGKPELL
jgi:Cyclic nucleotide-binding domain/Ion channel